MPDDNRIMVVSAHAADFCIRAGGTLARYSADGVSVRVLVLSDGARGESNEMWIKTRGQTSEQEVGKVRRAEAEAAAEVLGVEVAFFGYADQPLILSRDHLMSLVREIRTFRPRIILTHPLHEPYNPDHEVAARATLEAAYYAGLAGVEPDLPLSPPVQILLFEPTHPLTEATGFLPDTFIDVTDVIDQKLRAVSEFKVQPYHVERYRSRAAIRAAQAVYLTGNPAIHFAEAYQRRTPWVGRVFP